MSSFQAWYTHSTCLTVNLMFSEGSLLFGTMLVYASFPTLIKLFILSKNEPFYCIFSFSLQRDGNAFFPKYHTKECRSKEKKSIPEKHENKNSISVEVVKNQITNALVIPMSVHKEQSFQKPKLSHSKIRCHHCLPPFLTTYSNTNIRHLDHWNIISPWVSF